MTPAVSLAARKTRLCISPKWRLRKDTGRVIAYKYNTEEAYWKNVPPVTALILSLFDGIRTLSDVADIVQQIFSTDIDRARETVCRVVYQFHAKDDQVLVDANDVTDGNWPTYDPSEMIIAHDSFYRTKRLDARLSLILMPFNQCNVDCCYCYAERKPIKAAALLTIERWREILAEAADAGVSIAVFSGGDPMLYPEILQLLDVLVEYDFDFLVSTKTLVSRDRAMVLSEIGLGKRLFQISLDAMNPGTADFMVRREGYRKRALESITNLMHFGIGVRVNTVCTPHNYREAPALVSELISMGVHRCTVTIYGRSIYRHDDALFLSEQQIRWLREEMSAIRQQRPDADVRFNGAMIDYNSIPQEAKAERWPNRASCSGGRSSMTICADGRVLLCESMPHDDEYTVGNLKNQGLLEIWNSPRMREIAFPSRGLFVGTPCDGCNEFEICHLTLGYCFRDALNVYGSVYQPPPNCPRAPPSARLA